MQACNGGEAEGTGHDTTSQEISVSPDDIPTARIGLQGRDCSVDKDTIGV